jgi:hypothetical protein
VAATLPLGGSEATATWIVCVPGVVKAWLTLNSRLAIGLGGSFTGTHSGTGSSSNVTLMQSASTWESGSVATPVILIVWPTFGWASSTHRPTVTGDGSTALSPTPCLAQSGSLVSSGGTVLVVDAGFLVVDVVEAPPVPPTPPRPVVEVPPRDVEVEEPTWPGRARRNVLEVVDEAEVSTSEADSPPSSSEDRTSARATPAPISRSSTAATAHRRLERARSSS